MVADLPMEYLDGPHDGSPVTLAHGQREVIVPTETYSHAPDAKRWEGVYRVIRRWATLPHSRARVGVLVLVWAGERERTRTREEG